MIRALRSPASRFALAVVALHVALALWALKCWIDGPFAGDGIVDGAEMLAAARTGSAGPFETKSPLYPWLLGGALRAFGDSPWTVGLLGIALSVAVVLAVRALCVEFALERAAPFAMLGYALSGSAYVFAVQPLEPLLATALLAWGVVGLARARRTESASAALAGGLALGACVFARASLAPAVLAVVGLELCARPRRAALLALGGAAASALVAVALFGARAWPSGAMLNLRLGNGAARSGFCDVRPGPQYDRLRLEAAFAPVEDGAGADDAPEFELWQRAQLGRELAADPLGALATLGRKLFLFAHRTETVSDSDFRHGFAEWPPFAALIESFALLAPLALASLFVRPRPALAWAALAGVLAANVLTMTSARYRFPALPFVCVAAGVACVELRSRRVQLAAAAAFLALAPNWTGRELAVPGDGLAQEGRRLLALDRAAPRTLEVLERAVGVGNDARSRYELALAYEAHGRVDDALDAYRDALALEPLYPEPAENVVALLMRAGRVDEARAFAVEWSGRSPFAAKLWLARGSLERAAGRENVARELEGKGFALLALRALAENDLDGARRARAEARARGADDPRLARVR